MRNGLQEKKRSFFFVVGDHSKDVIVYLHHIMCTMDIQLRNKPVPWAYKNKLIGFTRRVFKHTSPRGSDKALSWLAR